MAQQYGMTYTPTVEEPECTEGTGNIDEVGGELCRTTPTNTPTSSADRQDMIEAVCIFPYYIDGIEYNECTLTEIKDFTRPQFICPIRTIKGRDNNYLIQDVDATYCPTTNDGLVPVNNTFNGQLELDPDNASGICLGGLYPVFATCKNTCPGGEINSL